MLQKSLRIPSGELRTLLRQGTMQRAEFVDFIYTVSSSKNMFACIVSKKVDRRATKRNRMKRLVAEAISQLLPEMKKTVCGVVIVRKHLPKTQQEVTVLIRGLIQKTGVILQ